MCPGVSKILYLFPRTSITSFSDTNLLYDWGFFIIAILIISSLHYTILTIVFDIPIQYSALMFSSILTFLVYPLFSKLFNQIYLIDLRQENAK